MSRTPLEVAVTLLNNLMNRNVVRELVANNATYVSLNAEDAELKRILPWTGTTLGPDSLSAALEEMFAYWQNEKFEVTDTLADGDKVAVFGSFTYRSNTLGKRVTFPFSVLIKVQDGKVVYLQFLEDTYATANSFRSGGSWIVHNDPNGTPFEV
jgi:uncharacterized protein